MTEIVEKYLQYCQAQRRLDEKTIKAYRIDLCQMEGQCLPEPLEAVETEALEAAIGRWHEEYKPKTVKRKIASGKAFFAWSVEKGLRKENPFCRLHTAFREPKVLPKVISEHNLEQFLQAMYEEQKQAQTAEKKKVCLKDIAVIELLFGTGMRISELCGLAAEDVNLVEGEILIHGKGRKERIVPIPDEELQALLTAYKTAWGPDISRTGRFFVNRNGRPLNDQSVRNEIQKYAEKAGISQHITPHMFRHTFATLLLESDINIRCIQEILGHSSIQTTEIYTHVSAAKQRQILREKHPRKRLQVK